MKYPNFDTFCPNDLYFEEIQSDLWLMDDHRWAYYIWEHYFHSRKLKDALGLIHLDYHYDGINDFKTDGVQKELLEVTQLDDIYQLVLNEKRIQYDSFIAPAIIRGLVNEIHFLCFQTETTPGIDPELLNNYSSKEFLHKDLKSLIKTAPEKSLFNIDLDIFNKSEIFGEGDLWQTSHILQFIENCAQLIKSAPLITIAMSFNYSGSKKDTKEISKLVIPKIIELRSG